MHCILCGCKISTIGYASSEKRKYCRPCEAHRVRTMRVCITCGEAFFSEEMEDCRCKECHVVWEREKRTCPVCNIEYTPMECRICDSLIEDLCGQCHFNISHSDELTEERICKDCGSSFIPRTCVIKECKQGLIVNQCIVCHEIEFHGGVHSLEYGVPVETRKLYRRSRRQMKGMRDASGIDS